MKFLEVNKLTIKFRDKTVVNNLSFDLAAGDRLGVIGESGSGKTMIALAIIGLLPDSASFSGSIRLDGKELLSLGDKRMSAFRGSKVSMVFQEPLTALNPLMRVGKQIAQPLRRHNRLSARESLARAIELCASVGLPDPEQTVRAYPHQLSGGQRQRVGLAIAIACNPKLLIVDEPTTALDVTVQSEVLQTINELVKQHDTSLIFISRSALFFSSIISLIGISLPCSIPSSIVFLALSTESMSRFSISLSSIRRTSDSSIRPAETKPPHRRAARSSV